MTHFCISCGAALRPTVKFCTACGVGVVADAEVAAGFEANASTATPLEDGADVTDFSTSKKPWIIGGSILALLVAFAIFMAFFAPKKSEVNDAAAAAGNAVSAVVANPAITGQAADMYIVADANVRDQPTAQGSSIVTKLTRGTKINGTLQIGADGTSAWMKLTDGTGYIGAVNLNTNAPPTLAKTFADMKWNVEEGTDLLAFPAAGSAVVAHLNMGDQTTLAGVTDNGYAEAKRSKGGVAYFFVTAGNDRTGALKHSGDGDQAMAGRGAGTAASLIAKCQSSPNLTGDNSLAADGENALQRAYNASRKGWSSADGPDISMDWRCMNGRVLACVNAFDAGGQKCFAPEINRNVTAEMSKFCQDNAGSDMFTFNRYSLWDWKCEGARPTIKGTRYTVDSNGYLSDEWVDVTNAL
jgi:hypothetical protein